MKRLLLILSMHLVTGELLSQDPVFSQFYASSLYLNPALSGLEKDVAFGLNYRSQWTNVNLPFRTFQFSAIHPILQRGIKDKHLGGVGATLFSDESGPNKELVSQGFSVASSYNFHLDATGNHLVAAALQFGVVQRQLNMDALQWSSQYSTAIGYDPSLPGESLASERVTSPVINAGLMWRLVLENRFEPITMHYHGVAVSNLNRPRGFYVDSREASAVLLKAHGGYLHTFANGVEISPNYLIQHHKKSTEVNVGAYGAYTLSKATGPTSDLKVSVGLWYRIHDSIIVTSGFSTAKWNFGLSYDANASSLERNFQGANAFEVSLGYRIKITKAIKSFSTPLM